MIGRGDCDACGMTRAMITDPSMPSKARRGKPHTHASAATRAASATTTRGCRSPARSTRGPASSGGCPAAADDGEGRRVVVSAPGPPAPPPRGARGRGGTRVIVFEATDGPGGQMRLAYGGGGTREIAERAADTLEGWLNGCDVRWSTAPRRSPRSTAPRLHSSATSAMNSVLR